MQEVWRCRFKPCVRKIPWRRKWQPTPVFLPGKFHGERSLVGYSSWGCKESDTAEQLNNNRKIDYRNWAPRYSGKESACQCRRYKIRSFNPWVGKIPWSRKYSIKTNFQQYSCIILFPDQRLLTGPHFSLV